MSHPLQSTYIDSMNSTFVHLVNTRALKLIWEGKKYSVITNRKLSELGGGRNWEGRGKNWVGGGKVAPHVPGDSGW